MKDTHWTLLSSEAKNRLSEKVSLFKLATGAMVKVCMIMFVCLCMFFCVAIIMDLIPYLFPPLILFLVPYTLYLLP